MGKLIRLTESHLPKYQYITEESRILTETCNEFIRTAGKISINEVFDNISYVSNHLYKNGYSSRNIDRAINQYLSEGLFDGFTQTLKEKLINWLLGFLPIPEGVKSFLKISLANVPLKDYGMFLSPLKNCEKIADVVIDSILEWLATEGLQKWDIGGGTISDTLRNSIADFLTDEGFVQNLQNKLNPVICDKIRSAFG